MKTEGYTAIEVAESKLMHWLMPLHYFYEKRGLVLPPVTFLDGVTMPDPERELLVHDRDMTPTLADYHADGLGLRVLGVERSDDYLLRMVILETLGTREPVEFGAIGIDLGRFEPEVRRLIEEGVEPLGGILNDKGMPHTSEPRGFFAISCDSLVSEALNAVAGTELFGRCNQLSDADGVVFADIVEVLPEHGGAKMGGGA
ncbi:MAG: hypothetical protein AAF591_13490 [Verrucomicrobiota bacterium]